MIKKKNNLILVGLPASGKSAVGKALAGHLNMNYYDTDVLLLDKIKKENQNIQTVQEGYSYLGPEKFREFESEVLKDLIKLQIKNSVFSTGGGIILKEENRKVLKNLGSIIFLNPPLDEIESRIEHQEKRPIFKEEKWVTLKKLSEERSNILKSLSNMTVEGSKSIENIVAEIVSTLKDF